MVKGLNDFPVLGISTTIEFLAHVLQYADFKAGNTYTDFIDKNFPGGKIPGLEVKYTDIALMTAAIAENLGNGRQIPSGQNAAVYDVWEYVGNWELGKQA